MTKRNFLAKRLHLATVVLSLSVVLVSGELLVRLFLPFNSPDTIRQYSLDYVPSVFSRHRLKPMGHFADSSMALGTKAAGNRYFINDIGYRGPNFSPRKPRAVKRIIVVGGSTVFDVNAQDRVRDESRDWPHLVERRLREKGYHVEVLNAGIPGHASFDSLGRLYSQLWIYEPDYVLFYGAWNDIKYFTRLSPESPLVDLFYPLDQKSNPFTDYQGWWDRLLCNSQLYVKLRNQYYGWKLKVGEEGIVPTARYQEEYSPFGIRQYRLNIQLIVDACINIGAVPILLTEATLVAPTNSEEERKLIRYEYVSMTHTALVKAFNESYNVIRSVAQEKGIAVLDLAKELNGKRGFFLDAVHLSREGSEEVAVKVADYLAVKLGKVDEKSEVRDGVRRNVARRSGNESTM